MPPPPPPGSETKKKPRQNRVKLRVMLLFILILRFLTYFPLINSHLLWLNPIDMSCKAYAFFVKRMPNIFAL